MVNLTSISSGYLDSSSGYSRTVGISSHVGFALSVQTTEDKYPEHPLLNNFIALRAETNQTPEDLIAPSIWKAGWFVGEKVTI